MITSFRNAALEAFFRTGSTRRLPAQQAAKRIRHCLQALDSCTGPADLVANAGLYYHSLAPMAPSRYSLRVTGNYRITFAWTAEWQPKEVDIEDYH